MLIAMHFSEQDVRRAVIDFGIRVDNQGFTTLVYRQLWKEGRVAVVKPVYTGMKLDFTDPRTR